MSVFPSFAGGGATSGVVGGGVGATGGGVDGASGAGGCVPVPGLVTPSADALHTAKSPGLNGVNPDASQATRIQFPEPSQPFV